MKLPFTLTILIIAGVLFWGLRERKELVTLREEHRKAILEAESLDVSTDLTKPFKPTKRTAREREDNTQKVKDFVEELTSFVKAIKESEESGQEPDEDMKKRMIEVLEGLLSLKGSDLKILIAEIRNRTDLPDGMGNEIIGVAIMMMAQQHPQAALALYTESSDLIKDNSIGSNVASVALSQWAKDQPLEALEWIKTRSGKDKDLVTDDAKNAVLAAAAVQDFGLAFQFATELNQSLTDQSFLRTMARAATTDEKRNQLLTVIRKQAELLTDKGAADSLLKSGAGSLFSELTQNGYDQSIAWINSAKLTPGEHEIFVGSLAYHRTKADTGKWLDWISTEGASDPKTVETTHNLVRDWTSSDYKAAGEWLAKSPAGSMKNEAVISYVHTVAPYDAEVAEQWADTLSLDQRTKAIRSIHSALKEKDRTAAAAFAKKHGIDGQ